MSDNMESNKREQIGKNDEVKVSDILEYLIVIKLSLHKYVENVETESDFKKQVNMSDKNESVERDEINKNYDVTLAAVDEEFEEIDKNNIK